MIYRTLGSTGLNVSVIGVGTWQFGGEWGVTFSEKEVDAILGAARDEGINLIDTAECYGDHLSERLVGTRTKHERDNWIIATKFGHRFHNHMDRTRHFEPADAREQLHGSLKALGTDYVDLLQFHSPTDEEFFNETLWYELKKLQAEGLTRFIGLSISDNNNLRQVESCPDAGCESLQIIYNRIDRAPEKSVFPAVQRLNIGVLARVPLASGFLTGKYRRDTRFPENDWRASWDKQRRESTIDEIEKIRSDELPADAPMAQWALAWPLKHPAVTAVIPGCKNVEQVRSNAEAIRWLER
jgi:myo-inositol catabolism protein IolS